MQFRSTSRFLKRYKKKKLSRMSSISKLQNLNIFFNKFLLNITFIFKYKYLVFKSYLKVNYNKSLINLNDYLNFINKSNGYNIEKNIKDTSILLNILLVLRYKVNILNNFFFIFNYLFRFVFFFGNFFKLNFFNSLKHKNKKKFNIIIRFIYSFFVLSFFNLNKFFKLQMEAEKQTIKDKIYCSMYERRFSGKI